LINLPSPIGFLDFCLIFINGSFLLFGFWLGGGGVWFESANLVGCIIYQEKNDPIKSFCGGHVIILLHDAGIVNMKLQIPVTGLIDCFTITCINHYVQKSRLIPAVSGILAIFCKRLTAENQTPSASWCCGKKQVRL